MAWAGPRGQSPWALVDNFCSGSSAVPATLCLPLGPPRSARHFHRRLHTDSGRVRLATTVLSFLYFARRRSARDLQVSHSVTWRFSGGVRTPRGLAMGTLMELTQGPRHSGGDGIGFEKNHNVQAKSPDSSCPNPGPLTYWLCDLGQVTLPLCASVSSSTKEE